MVESAEFRTMNLRDAVVLATDPNRVSEMEAAMKLADYTYFLVHMPKVNYTISESTENDNTNWVEYVLSSINYDETRSRILERFSPFNFVEACAFYSNSNLRERYPESSPIGRALAIGKSYSIAPLKIEFVPNPSSTMYTDFIPMEINGERVLQIQGEQIFEIGTPMTSQNDPVVIREFLRAIELTTDFEEFSDWMMKLGLIKDYFTFDDLLEIVNLVEPYEEFVDPHQRERQSIANTRDEILGNPGLETNAMISSMFFGILNYKFSERRDGLVSGNDLVQYNEPDLLINISSRLAKRAGRVAIDGGAWRSGDKKSLDQLEEKIGLNKNGLWDVIYSGIYPELLEDSFIYSRYFLSYFAKLAIDPESVFEARRHRNSIRLRDSKTDAHIFLAVHNTINMFRYFKNDRRQLVRHLETSKSGNDLIAYFEKIFKILDEFAQKTD